MSYSTEDDAHDSYEIREKIRKLEEIVHDIHIPQSENVTYSGRNLIGYSFGGGKNQSMGGRTSSVLAVPLIYGIHDYGDVGGDNISTNLEIDLGNDINPHIHKFVAKGTIGLSFLNKPESGEAIFFVMQITQDDTGGHSITTAESLTEFDIDENPDGITILTGMVLDENVYLTNYGSRITNVIERDDPGEGGEDWWRFPAQGNVNINGNSVEKLSELSFAEFSGVSSKIVPRATHMEYMAGRERSHQFKSDNGTILAEISASEINAFAKPIINVSGMTLVGDNPTIQGIHTLDFDGNNTKIQGIHNILFSQANHSIISTSEGLRYKSASAFGHQFIFPGSIISPVIIRPHGIDTRDIRFNSPSAFAINETQIGKLENENMFLHVERDKDLDIFFGESAVPKWVITETTLSGERALFEQLHVDNASIRQQLLFRPNENPTANGIMALVDNDLIAFSGGQRRNLSDIGDSFDPSSIIQSLLPNVSGVRDLGSNLFPWRIGHFREIEFSVNSSVPNSATDTQISKNVSGNMAFNNDAPGGGYQFYFRGVNRWGISPSILSGENIILTQTLTLQDYGRNSDGFGTFSRNGDDVTILTSEGLKNLKDIGGGGSGSFDPSSIIQSLIPTRDDQISLGSNTKKWNNLYIDVIHVKALQGEGDDIRLVDDLDLDAATTINFPQNRVSPISSNASPIGAIGIKVNGILKKIPYYDV